MKNRRIDYILFSFLILFTIFVVLNIKERQYLFFKQVKDTHNIEVGFEIGYKTTLRCLYLDGYLPDTVYIDKVLFDDVKKFYTKKLE